MAQKDMVFKQVIKKKGYFNFTEVYTFIFGWFKDLGYIIIENNYTEKSGDGGKEILISWTIQKKVTDYYKYQISIDWHILGLSNTEVVRDNKKEKTNKGDLKLTIQSDLIKDYEAQWEQTPFQKFLRAIYDKYIIRTTTEEYQKRLIEDTVEAVGEIKSFLELT